MAKTPHRPVAALLYELGGAQAVAESMAPPRKVKTVRMWMFRDTVPRHVWPDLIEAFPKTVTLERLRDIEAKAA